MEDNVNVLEEADAVVNIVKGLADEKGLQVIRDIDLSIPRVSCDRRRVRRALLNLMSDAIKFTEKGSVTLQLKKHDGALQFPVTDTEIE